MQALDEVSLIVRACGTAALVATGALPRDEELALVESISAALVCSFVLAAIALLLGIEAPYGRYSKSGWGFMLPGKLAWIVQESPNLVAVLWAILLAPATRNGGQLQSLPNVALLGMFTLVRPRRSARPKSTSSATPLPGWRLTLRCLETAAPTSTTSTAPSSTRCVSAAASPPHSSHSLWRPSSALCESPNSSPFPPPLQIFWNGYLTELLGSIV